MLHIVSSLAILTSFATAHAPKADSAAELRRADLMAALRSGGYTVILRHARTDMSFKEETGSVPKERSMQRNLTDDGVRDAALMGVVFRKYGITFSEIIASPMYRAIETAEMAAGTPTTTMALRVFPSTPEQEALIKAAPKKGTNRLLVTHHFVIETHVPGITPGSIGESEAAVIRHLPNGNVELVGRIKLDDWQALASPPPSTGPAPSAGAPAGAHAAPPPPITPGAPTELPRTSLGVLARKYISAFSTGNADSMRVFIESSFVADPARPTSLRLESFAKLFGDHGPLSMKTVEGSMPNELTLGMHSRVGDFRMTLKTADAQATRISSLSFLVPQGAGQR